jgi:hypothetical protein
VFSLRFPKCGFPGCAHFVPTVSRIEPRHRIDHGIFGRMNVSATLYRSASLSDPAASIPDPYLKLSCPPRGYKDPSR